MASAMASTTLTTASLMEGTAVCQRPNANGVPVQSANVTSQALIIAG